MSSSQTNELELIDAAKAGSVLAFTELVQTYRQGLLRFLMTRCASYADAEDVLQDTLINAYRYIQSYDSRWRFSTWLYRIAIRNAGNAATARQHYVTDVGELRDHEDDPLAACIKAGERENLWRCARRLLNNEVYTAMWLRYVEDMSVKDVAAALDRSGSWAKVNLMRGRKLLSEELNSGNSAAEGKVYG